MAKAVSRRLQCGTSRGQADWVSDILAGKPSYSVDDARARSGGVGGVLGGWLGGWGGEVQYGGEMEEDDELKMLTDRLPRKGEPMLPVCIVCV